MSDFKRNVRLANRVQRLEQRAEQFQQRVAGPLELIALGFRTADDGDADLFDNSVMLVHDPTLGRVRHPRRSDVDRLERESDRRMAEGFLEHRALKESCTDGDDRNQQQ